MNIRRLTLLSDSDPVLWTGSSWVYLGKTARFGIIHDTHTLHITIIFFWINYLQKCTFFRCPTSGKNVCVYSKDAIVQSIEFSAFLYKIVIKAVAVS